MSKALLEQITTALAQFTSATRLYELTLHGADTGADLGAGGLLVEAFAADDIVHGIGTRDIIALSTNAHIDLAPLLGRQASLEISLADGTRATFSGDITHAAMLGSEGGLARYRLRLTPWLWRLTQVRNSRVWQDKSVIDIVDDVLSAYQPLAQWRWSEETDSFLADVPPRSYCCQYRESDYDFARRLLTEERSGLARRGTRRRPRPGAVRRQQPAQCDAVGPVADQISGCHANRDYVRLEQGRPVARLTEAGKFQRQ